MTARKSASGGFTLLEILVVVGIVGVITAVAIPNLRNFSRTQEIENAAGQLMNVLKQAQSYASSGVQCPENEAADSWTVRISNNEYLLISQCKTEGDKTLLTSPYAATPTEQVIVFEASTDVCDSSNTDIIFTGTRISYKCPDDINASIGPININLTNSAGDLSYTVKVEPGGIIKGE